MNHSKILELATQFHKNAVEPPTQEGKHHIDVDAIVLALKELGSATLDELSRKTKTYDRTLIRILEKLIETGIVNKRQEERKRKAFQGSTRIFNVNVYSVV